MSSRLTLGVLKQRGDTIVEVLIAVAVASSVLTAAFATSNASLKQIRMAQEHSEAQKIAAASVEKLEQFYVDADVSSLATITPSPFCIDYDAVTSKFKAVASTEPVCTEQGRYTAQITRDGGAASKVFNVHIEWDNVNNNTDKVDLRYEVQGN